VSRSADDVGIVFQSPVLLAWRTVLDNVMLQIQMRICRARYTCRGA
jgi:NitT/TauT family transport system ATP-binding protein